MSQADSATSSNLDQALPRRAWISRHLPSRTGRRVLKAADRWLTLTIEALVVAALSVELVVMFGNMMARSFFNAPWAWSDEVGSDMLSIITFVGAALAVQRGQLISLNAIVDRLSLRGRQIALATGDWIMVASGILLILLSRSFLELGLSATAPTLTISAFWTELAFPVGVTLFLINVLRCRLATYPIRILLSTGPAVVIGAALFWVIQDVTTLSSTTALFVTLAAFAVLVVMAMPIMFAFVVAAGFFLLLSKIVPISTIPPTVWNAPRDPVLLAIPFFTWAGFILTRGRLGPYLARFLLRTIGHVRGGILHVVVVAMYLFSGISGSKIADMAAVSATLKDAVGDKNDDGRYTAVLNASAAMGETIPPSIGIIVIGTITSISVISLFLAGLLPALALAVCLMVIIYLQALLRREPRQRRSPISQVAKAFVLAVPTLVIPVVLIGGVIGGYATPTEVSAVAVVYALLAVTVFYRKMTWRDMWALTVETLSIAGMALFALSAATEFSFTLTIAQVPNSLSNWITSLHIGPSVFLILCCLFLVIMGSLLEGLPSLLIFMPLLLGPAIALHINPLQFAIVVLVAIGIGVHAPPLGIGYYVACMLTDKKPEAVMRQMWLYDLVLLIGLMILILVPGVTLWLPHVFGHS
jgi:tripartite ATP-independent transporter DctM subunit